MPVFTIRGRREIGVEGCTGILAYTEEQVILAAGTVRFTVTGRRLSLENFAERSLTVRGEIVSASFGAGEGEEET